MTTTKKNLQVKCPKCKTSFDYYSVTTRPFCSERCKMVDLGHWLSENYKMPTGEKPNDEELEKLISEYEDKSE